MNLILLFPEDFTDENRARLTGRRLAHVREIHRALTGDQLRVGVANGKIGVGRVSSLSEDALELEVTLNADPPEALPVTLILALPRPKILRRVIRSTTTLGVKRIILLNSYRVEKSYWQTPFLHQDAIREQLVLGLEQSCDTVLPTVVLQPLFKPFVEDQLPLLLDGTTALVAHPGASEQCPRGVGSPVTLVIGPEGGFIQYEADKLVSIGCRLISLGERILPVETAVPALITRVL